MRDHDGHAEIAARSLAGMALRIKQWKIVLVFTRIARIIQFMDAPRPPRLGTQGLERKMNKFASQQDYENIEAVQDAYPGAAEIIEVEGGWMVFDTVTDADTWRNQA